MSRRSCERLTPYTPSDVARFTNMLLSLWLSPWGKLVDLEVYLPSVPLLSVKGIQLAVFTAQRFVASWAEPTDANAAAEACAVAAVLLAEVAAVTCRALVDGAGSRSTRRHSRKWSWVSSSPSCLTTRLAAEHASAGATEATSAHRAGQREAIVTQRVFRQHDPSRLAGGRVVARPCRLSPGLIGRCPQT